MKGDTYVLVTIPKGVHLFCSVMLFEEEMKKNSKEQLKNLVDAKLDNAKYSILDALEMKMKRGQR